MVDCWAAFITAYPYNFLNVAELGLSTALVNLGGITVLGIVLGIIYWAIDRVLSRKPSVGAVTDRYIAQFMSERMSHPSAPS